MVTGYIFHTAKNKDVISLAEEEEVQEYLAKSLSCPAIFLTCTSGHTLSIVLLATAPLYNWGETNAFMFAAILIS